MSSILYNDKLYGGAITTVDANHVLYDNTDSGLTSSNVQDVVDELDEVIESLESPTFTEASTRANIASGESLATIFGKVKKVITDLEAVAFSGTANDVSYDNTSSDLTSSNVQGAIDELSNNVNNLIINSADGSIVSFDDGADGIPVRDLKVQMEPIQDLHGYDNPWPAGGGKNLLSVNLTSRTTSGVTITVNDDGTMVLSGTASAYIFLNLNYVSGNVAFPAGNYLLNGGLSLGGFSMRVYDSGSKLAEGGGASDIPFTIPSNTTGNYIRIDIATGTTFNNVTIKPMVRLSTVSDATFAPYSNICPISGRDSVTVTRTGFNVWDEEWESGAYSVTNGTKITRDSAIRCKNLIPVMPNTSYYKKSPSPGIYWNIYYDADRNYLTYNSSPYNAVFTTPSDAYFMATYTEGGYGTTYNHDICINYPATDTDYHAGHVQTVEIPLGQTVYGGTLDVTTGVLTVTMAEVDLGTLDWQKENTVTGKWRFYAGFTAHKRTTAAEIPNMKCSAYPTITGNQTWQGLNGISNNGQSPSITLCDLDYSDVSTFKAAMSGVYLVYELATPQTYQLTPQQLTTLLGQNNVWSDADSISLEYATNNYVWDTLHKIDTNIQNLEANGIAYDNTDSGLTADTVQDALDEIDLNSLKSKHQISDYNDAPFTTAFAPDTATNTPYTGCWSTVLTYGTAGNAPGVTENYIEQVAIPWYYGKKTIALRQKDNGTWGSWEYFVSASGFMTKRDAVVNDQTGIAANASKTFTPSPLTVSGYRPIMFSFMGGPYMDFCTFNFGDTAISGNSITFGTFYIVNRSTTNLPALMVMMQSLWVPISG